MLSVCHSLRGKDTVFVLKSDGYCSILIILPNTSFLGVPLRVGLYRASLRFGASTSLTAALPIPNALRPSNICAVV